MTRPWQILLAGFICLVLLFFAIADLRVAYAIACLILFGGFAVGFLFQPKAEFVSFTLPAFEGPASVPVMNGTQLGEAFPQVIIFRIELINLALLAFVAFIPVAILVWILAGNDVSVGNGFPPSNVVIVPLYLFWLPFSLIRIWISERSLLRNPQISWGLFRLSGDCCSYQFFDPQGDRRGGLANTKFRKPDPLDNIALVVAKANNLDENKLSFSFLFHRFIVVGRKHTP